jgi:hypothetical protein
MNRSVALIIALCCLRAALAANLGEARSAAGKEPKMKKLNNLVTELLSVTRAGSQPEQEYWFTNPRDGWVFFASSAEVAPGGSVEVAVGADDEGDHVTGHSADLPGPMEAMRLLPAGRHKLVVRCEGKAALQSLTVRAIPELIYCRFQSDPHVAEYGPYDWNFLAEDVIPNINTIVGGRAESERPHAARWHAWGKRWIIECGVPGLARGASVTADEAEKYWGENIGMRDPSFDGIIADEFFGGESDKYRAWTEAIRRIQRNPRFKGKTFYPYCGTMYEGQASREFIQRVMDAGWRLAWERYLREEPTEAEARALLAEELRGEMLAWRTAQPGVEKHTIICLGYLSAPPESLDTDPSVDYKVWMDMQFNTLANDSAFDGLHGVMEYLSSYADEEYLRWAGRLYRHYCIEGETTPLTRDPYVLPHLRNGDFDHGLDGWTAAPAEPGSIAVKSMEGYSWLEGRYPKTSQGDTFLWMKRSAQRPNTVSQVIKGLEPGRYYSLRMFSGDYGELSVQQKHVVSISLEGVEAVGDKSLQHVFPNCYSHHLGPYDAEHHAWMNFHRRIFRAKSPQARLIISDWATNGDPGGPIGQELMLNFVQVQPYLAD